MIAELVTPTFATLAIERDLDCRWVVGPIPKLDGHTCRCDRLRNHRMPHECGDCGAWFEGCGRDLRKTSDRIT